VVKRDILLKPETLALRVERGQRVQLAFSDSLAKLVKPVLRDVLEELGHPGQLEHREMSGVLDTPDVMEV
jgi:hypothetical protein